MSWAKDFLDLAKEPKIFAMYIPGFILTVAVIVILFFPFNISQNSAFINSTIGLMLIIIGTFVLGVFVHKIGKWIEKYIFDDWWKLDLKSIGNIYRVTRNRK